MPIFGECQSAQSLYQVVITDLEEVGCWAHFEGQIPCADVLDLWIGAVGPFAGRVRSRHSSMLEIQFAEPLDRRLTLHFAEFPTDG